MSKFSDKFVDGMSLVAEKVDENKFLGAIKDSPLPALPSGSPHWKR